MSKKTTKRALAMSFVSVFLCVCMLVGTTFAWFTDSVTSSENIIKSGTLDVEMYYADGTKAVPTDASGWTDASTGAIFDYDLWEPGYTVARHIKIANVGTLALKYQLNIIANGEVSELANVIDVYFIDPANKVASRTDLDSVTPIGTLAQVLAGMPASTSAELLKGESDTVTIALKMQETAGNTYQNLSIGSDFAVQLMATQLTAEEDAFDDQYDKGAWHPDFTVTSVEDLAAALANGGKIQVNGTLNAGATQDVPNWTNAPAEFIFDATTLDALKGGKYVLEQGSRYGVVGLISAGESLALSDMEITANSQWPAYLSNYGGTLTLEDIDVTATDGAGIYPYGTNGTTTIKSATVNQKALSDEFASSTPWAGTAIATSNGHNLIIEDGTYVGSTWGVYVYNSGANVTINGGTFKAPMVIQADGVWSTGGNKSVVTVNDGNFDGALYLDWGTTPPEIYINGGNFTNFSATVNGAAKLVIKGGTFDADPSAYVADGYTAVENNGVWTVLPGNVSAVVSTTNDLANAIKNAPTATNDNIIYLTDGTYGGDINITVAALGASGGDVVIKAMEGTNPVIAGTVTLGYRNQGVGATMYNANVTFEGITFDHAAPATHSLNIQDVKSLTLKNCTIIGDGEYGIGCARGNGTGTSKIVGCTFENAGMQLLGNFATGLVIDQCTFNESCINVQAGNGVTVQNCEFNNTLTSANVDESFYLVRSNSTPITVKNCEINIDSELTDVAASQARWGVLWNRGTTNWTVENVAVTTTSAAQAQTELLITKRASTGVINTTNLTVNGVVQ